MELVLPRSTVELIGKVRLNERHPGLQLDKYSSAGEQTRQREALDKVCQTVGDKDFFKLLGQRREKVLHTLPGNSCFSCTTVGPLTLHLSRASALENAGICLHPLYGFVYLPGSGLKGMARAYAETIWLLTQLGGDWHSASDQQWNAALDQIDAVFGYVTYIEPSKDVRQQMTDFTRELDRRRKERNKLLPKDAKSHVGNIVFHDAWPESWPQLIVDIVNNHHSDYYSPPDAKDEYPPGDWENPNPVYFLAVPSGTTFQFALSPRRAGGKELLQRAKEWLVGALCHLGAGAKTAAGYGSFRPVNEPTPPLPSSSRERFEATLELVTPAFLAGANQQADDCDLRPATLRGLLRWWWRTMHAGYVDVATLRRMEAALWGDTNSGGAIRIEVQPETKTERLAYDKQKEARQNNLPKPPNNKTTQGLWYHSYGMHDGGKQRQYVKPGSKWKLIFLVRDAVFVRLDRKGKPIKNTERVIPKVVVLDQARAALWWLCALGGVGSKARNGFGNFNNPPELGDAYYGAKFVSKGKLLREACGVPEEGFRDECALSPALRQMVNLGRKVNPDGNGWIEVSLDVSNVWQALERVGMNAQRFAQKHKHQREKQALGLPRRIGHPAQGQFRPGPGVTDRHASPVHYHFHQQDGKFVLRVAAFPSPRLPNLQASQNFLEELLRYFNSSTL